MQTGRHLVTKLAAGQHEVACPMSPIPAARANNQTARSSALAVGQSHHKVPAKRLCSVESAHVAMVRMGQAMVDLSRGRIGWSVGWLNV